MKTITKSTNFEMTPSISEYVEKKLESLNKFIDPNDESVIVRVELGKSSNHHRSGDIFRVEINVSGAHKDARAVAEREDLYSAIDEVKDSILAELRSKKEKQQHFIRRGSQKLKNLMKGFWNGAKKGKGENTDL